MVLFIVLVAVDAAALGFNVVVVVVALSKTLFEVAPKSGGERCVFCRGEGEAELKTEVLLVALKVAEDDKKTFELVTVIVVVETRTSFG